MNPNPLPSDDLTWTYPLLGLTEPPNKTGRGSGRTTRMCIRAALCITRGERVVVMAFRISYAHRLRNDILEMAKRLGAQGDLRLMCRVVVREMYHRGYLRTTTEKVFDDHYYEYDRSTYVI